MSEIAELERRITAALERIGRGVDGLAARTPAPVPVEDGASGDRAAARAEAAAASARAADLQAAVDHLTRQLDVCGLDLQRMRKVVIQLRETVRSLREAQTAGLADAGAINAALAVEVEALRLERQAELAEMEAILAALKPLAAEVQDA
jgi:predicted  nucleic acid-binding Zn-ribbon protein